MTYSEVVGQTGILYLRPRDRLDLEELYDVLTQHEQAADHKDQAWRLTVSDLRDVHLTVEDAEAFQKFVERRRRLFPQPTESYLAMVVSDLHSYGVMRMYGVFADLGGLRPEANHFITMEWDDMVQWIRAHVVGADSSLLSSQLYRASTRGLFALKHAKAEEQRSSKACQQGCQERRA